MLWTRTIGSTIVGQAVDTTLVVILTFIGSVPAHTLLNAILTGYALKVGYEVLATPLTYLVIRRLKIAEQSDIFDRNENFNPFSFSGTTPAPDSEPDPDDRSILNTTGLSSK
jgi:queuosine precursor transporter